MSNYLMIVMGSMCLGVYHLFINYDWCGVFLVLGVITICYGVVWDL